MSMKKIEFLADTDKWVAVKKLEITPSVDDLDVARFLASVNQTMQRKMMEYIARSIATPEELDEIAAGCCGAEKTKKGWKLKGRISEDKINQVMAVLKSNKTSKQINAVVKEKKAVGLAKQYVIFRAFELIGFSLSPDPKQIEKLQTGRELAD